MSERYSLVDPDITVEEEITVDPDIMVEEEIAVAPIGSMDEFQDETGVEMARRGPLVEGPSVVHFPNDVTVVKHNSTKQEYVTLPRAQLETMVSRHEVEAMKAMMVQERRARQELEGMVQSLMQERAPSTTTKNPRLSTADHTEIMQLVDHRMEAIKNQEEEEEWHAPFGESVFTLLYMCKFCSQSFFYSIFVYCVQMATISLTLTSIASDDNPHMVDFTVMIAQGVTLLLLLASQSDLIEAVLKLQDGFYPEVQDIHPGADFETWLVSCIAQLLAGCLLLATSFVLTLKADTVIDLMLNLTALLFMSEIDDLGFAIGKYGFVTDKIQKQCEAVIDFKVPKRKSRNMYRRILYAAALIGLFGGWGYLKGEQLGGKYLPTFLYVQFGDAYNPKIPYYSGILTSGSIKTWERREYRDVGTENILLGYCVSEKAWTFSDVNDTCKYFAKSFETETFDVALIPDSGWQVVDSIQRLQPFDSFSLVNRDCQEKICQGTCVDGLCQCPPDQFGIDCEFSNVCTKLAMDERFEGFPSVRHYSFSAAASDEFEALKNPATNEFVKVYRMPVYYSNKTYPANVIFFGGRRWIFTSEWDLFNMTEAKESSPERWYFPEKTIATFEGGFHGHYQAAYTPFFISDPVDFETPDFQPTPIGLKWWTVQRGKASARHFVPDLPLESTIICDSPPPSCVGQPEIFCGTGECNNATGLCECAADLEYYGDFCELQKPCYDQFWPCSGNGVCDVGSGNCRCNLPYFGSQCEDHYECYEEGGVCKNGGICDMATGHCDCPDDPAISGVACEKRGDCSVYGCENGGICGPNGACVCPPPYKGAHCQVLDTTQKEKFCSTDEDCMNGSCNKESGTCVCENPTSYGTLCEHQYNCSAVPTWAGDPCSKQGICNATTNMCDCRDPYFGFDCSQVPPCVQDMDCAKGEFGECNIDTGLCECAFGSLQGKRCERHFSCRTPFSEFECYNGGTCNSLGVCMCVAGYSGTVCEAWVADSYDLRWDQVQADLVADISSCGFYDPFCGANVNEFFETVTRYFGSFGTDVVPEP